MGMGLEECSRVAEDRHLWRTDGDGPGGMQQSGRRQASMAKHDRKCPLTSAQIDKDIQGILRGKNPIIGLKTGYCILHTVG